MEQIEPDDMAVGDVVECRIRVTVTEVRRSSRGTYEVVGTTPGGLGVGLSARRDDGGVWYRATPAHLPRSARPLSDTEANR